MTRHADNDGIWAAARRRAIVFQTHGALLGAALALADEMHLGERLHTAWSTRTDPGDPDGIEVLAREALRGREARILRLDGTLAHVSQIAARVDTQVFAADRSSAERAMKRLRAAFPEHQPEDNQQIAFTFSWSHDCSVRQMSRVLDVPRWREIQPNYASATRAGLRSLMRRRLDGTGQTVIWHGEPGTGKTTALRALAWEWRRWCDFHVVTDPDQLFGSCSNYLLELLSSGLGGDDRHLALVLEDAGEILAADARRFVGQGLSRFLNVCDGLLGQGEKLLLLVTTNEPVKRLHPAVSRPGRCAAEIEFAPLSTREANRWLKECSPARVTEPTPLADLFALASGSDPALESHRAEPIGFAASLGG